jgi:hypothetical protein
MAMEGPVLARHITMTLHFGMVEAIPSNPRLPPHGM